MSIKSPKPNGSNGLSRTLTTKPHGNDSDPRSPQVDLSAIKRKKTKKAKPKPNLAIVSAASSGGPALPNAAPGGSPPNFDRTGTLTSVNSSDERAALDRSQTLTSVITSAGITPRRRDSNFSEADLNGLGRSATLQTHRGDYVASVTEVKNN